MNLKSTALIVFSFCFLLGTGFSDCNRSSDREVPQPGAAAKEVVKPLVWKKIKNVVVVVLENTALQDALKQPFLQEFASKGALLSNYFGVTHPSQPNYIALVAGNTHGVGSNSNATLPVRHLGDLFQEQRKGWRVYAEDYPGNCFLGASSGDYARKHVPVLSFLSVQTDPLQCGKVVTASQFEDDLRSNRLPEFSLYIPNQRNDGHDTGVAYADQWFSKKFASWSKLQESNENTLWVVTFDEDNGSGGNRVYTALYGAGVRRGGESKALYNHYSLLRTLELIFDLGSLGQNDQVANAITDIWQ